jgi:hypothetical protein
MSTPVEVGRKDEVQQELEEGPGRYAAYLLRIKTLIKTSSRYIACVLRTPLKQMPWLDSS